MRRRAAAGWQRWLAVGAGLVVLLALAGTLPDEDSAASSPTAAERPAAVDPPTQPVARQPVARVAAPARAAAERDAIVLAGVITDVVDGDTIKVEARGVETTVRLIGIDTPETRHPAKPVQCFGPAASRQLRRLLPIGQRVRLVSDPTQDTRDRYGRFLAYVLKPGRSRPSGSVNYSLVASGHAKSYVYGGVPFRDATAYQAAEDRARAQDRGLWGRPCHGDTDQPDPSDDPPPAPRPIAAPEAAEPQAGNCDPNYAGACIPPVPPDLDCGDVSATDFASVGSDPHGFDSEGDGLACEG